MPTKGSKYETWQKREIQAVIDGLNTPFTIKDVCDALARLRLRVSRATVYRVLGSLCLEGRIREIFLPDGRRVCAHALEGATLCIIECVDCGKLSSCDASGVDSCLSAEAKRRCLNPLHTSAYMRVKCDATQCRHLRNRSSINSKNHQP